MTEKVDIEMVAMQLIVSSGEAKSLSFEALELAKAGKFSEAEVKIKEANALMGSTHGIQTDLIQKEASGEHIAINLLLVHAQDHLMTSMLAKDLITQMIELLKNQK
jgi:PTS system cellobiose-specific IIA component